MAIYKYALCLFDLWKESVIGKIRNKINEQWIVLLIHKSTRSTYEFFTSKVKYAD